MTPYPFIFCPPGVDKPACCAHMGQVRQTATGGPEGTGGVCWGGPYDPEAARWVKTAGGWYIGDAGHRPQDLVRLNTHPRVVKWHQIPGALEDQWWRVPVLLTLTGDDPSMGFVSAIDRLWDGSAWTASSDLQALQEPLLAITLGVPLKMDQEDRNQAIIDLAIGILAVGQWIDRDFLAATGWLSETVMGRVIHGAADNPNLRMEIEA